MTTNQTIDGVPRELLERRADYDAENIQHTCTAGTPASTS